MKKSFLELFTRLQTRDISDMSPNPFMWRWQFLLLAEKKNTRYLLSAYVGVFFRVHWHKLALKQIHQETFDWKRKKLHC